MYRAFLYYFAYKQSHFLTTCNMYYIKTPKCPFPFGLNHSASELSEAATVSFPFSLALYIDTILLLY